MGICVGHGRKSIQSKGFATIASEGKQKEWWAGPDLNRGSLGSLRAWATPSGDPNQESFLARGHE
jgi:hypothetical protein